MQIARRFAPLTTGLAVALILALTGQAHASPITYTESATASGTLGAQSFTDALVTLTLNGDTSNVTGGSGFFSNSVGTFTVDVAGIGTATFTDSMQVFDNQGSIAAGFGDNTQGGSVLDTFDATFATYDLTTAIGPITNSNFIRPDLTFATTLGGFNIQSAGLATFTASTAAVAAPEPASLTLLGLGIASLAGYRLRRRS